MSMADELERLQSLHTQGVLSGEEFQQAKARLLAESQPPPPPAPDEWNQPLPPSAPAIGRREQDVRQWALFLHLSKFAGFVIPLGGLILPIVLWQIKKVEWPEIDAHGRVIMNWILSEILYIILCIPLCFIIVGIPLLIVVVLLGLIFPVIGAIKANDGIVWKYPLSIPFFS